MMKPLTLLLVVLPLVCHATHPLGFFRGTKKCTEAGPFCESCSSLVVCKQDEDGTWYKEKGRACLHREKCLNGECTTEADPVCDGVANLQFVCKKPGIFPDPFYCNKYVLCVDNGWGSLVPFHNTCEEGYGYNIGTDLCDIPLPDGQCAEREYPIPVCKKAGQSGPLDEKPTLFYTCEQYSFLNKKLYPVLDRCPHGQVYHDYQCSDLL